MPEKGGETMTPLAIAQLERIKDLYETWLLENDLIHSKHWGVMAYSLFANLKALETMMRGHHDTPGSDSDS